MADSDDDSEHHRSRDKFRRERSDADGRHRATDKREPFDDRSARGYGNRSRGDGRTPSDYRHIPNGRDRPPMSGEPPSKRARRNVNEDFRSPYRPRDTRRDNADDEANYRPPLMPFKRFLDPLDDFITDVEAVLKYKEYKEGFNKRYIEEFFEAHKDEEWLREKYHPDFIDGTRELAEKNIRHRLDVFLDLFDKGLVDNQCVQMDNTKRLVKLMDAVVIKLSGGTDEDLAVLDSESGAESDVSDELPEKKSKSRRNSARRTSRSEGEDSDFDDSEEEQVNKKVSRKASPSKPATTTEDYTGVSSDSEEGENKKSTKDAIPGEGIVEEEDYGGDVKEDSDHEMSAPHESVNTNLGEGELDTSESKVKETSSSSPRQPIEDEQEGGVEEKQDKVDGEPVASVSSEQAPLPPSASRETGDDPTQSAEAVEAQPSVAVVTTEEPNGLKRGKKCNLHKTASIFFRCLPPSVTRKELEELCSSHPGFLRLAIYDPMPERRFTRHAWATYKPKVNIKKICWAINTSPLLREKWNSADLSVTVNRDLTQRIRPVSATLTRHRPVMRNDLRIASRLIAQLDAKHNLWSLPGEEEGGEAAVTNACPVPGLPGVLSANPLMRNLTDFLVDETAGEEEAMLAGGDGIGATTGDGGDTSTKKQSRRDTSPAPLDTDESLLRALDRLLIYLRIVYSIDYYSATMYQLEDAMPHRCGILHGRGDIEKRNGVTMACTVTQREVNDYLNNFNEKMAPLLEVPTDLTDSEIAALGARDPEKVAEDFIEANIQKKTSKKKPYKVVWVCPLSDKKFRETIFVRKHILNKHMDKVEAAKKDNALFFNNFLRDPRRPSLPEAPRNLVHRYYPSAASGGAGGGGDMTASGDRPGGFHGGMRGGRNFGGGFRNNNQGYRGGFRGNNSFGRRDFFGDGQQQHQGGNYADNQVYSAMGRSPPGGGDFGGRYNKRPYPGSDRRGRGVISYNDLDDPGNADF